MKIGGKAVESLAKREIELPRGDGPPIRLVVHALPLDFASRQEELFPAPPVPVRMVLDERKRPVKDPDTNRTEWREDVHDPAYKREAAAQDKRQATYMVWLAIKDDPQVEFEVDGKSIDKDPEAFIDAIYADMAKSGINTGDFAIIQAAALAVSNVDKDLIDAVRASFLPPGTRRR